MKKLLVLIIAFSFLLSLGGFALADKDKYKKLDITDEMVKGATEVRLEAIRSGHIGTAQFLADEIDFWGEFTKRLIKTGNLIGIQESKDKMVAGFEVTLAEFNSIYIVGGIIPRDNNQSAWFAGVQFRGFPLASGLSQIFSRFDPGVVLYNGEVKFAVSFCWREEEVKKRIVK